MYSKDQTTLTAEMISTLWGDGAGVECRYTINFSDFAPFYRTDLPLFLDSLAGLQKENRERLLWEGETVTDMPSFQSFIRKLMKDIHIYSNNQ